MSTAQFLQKLPAALKPEMVEDLECVVQLNISNPYFVTVKDGMCTVAEGTADEADVSLTLSDENMIALLTGKLAGVMAFMTGKLKVDGDLMLAKQIPDCFDAAKLA